VESVAFLIDNIYYIREYRRIDHKPKREKSWKRIIAERAVDKLIVHGVMNLLTS
jgi:hypothetical protein